MVSVKIIVGKSGSNKILAPYSIDLSGKVSNPHIKVVKTLPDIYGTEGSLPCS
jgi:hypothetical protein